MKKIALFYLTLTLISCSNDNTNESDNQTLIDEPIVMVSELNKWYQKGSYEYQNGATATSEITKRYLIYFFEGDTLINGLEYKKMYTKQLDSIFHQPFSGGSNQYISTSNSINYTAAMRQNSDLVYYIYNNQNTEESYADFNINLGDVLNYRWNVNNEIVTEIDSIQIGSKYLTRFKLSNNQYFYEGIGASFGLFKGWNVGFEGGVYLSCFKYDHDKIGITDGFNSSNNYCPELE